MLIAKSAIQAFLSRERDDWRWMKKLSAPEFSAVWQDWKRPPSFKTEPWLHQCVGFTLGATLPEFMFSFDMGAGKTKTLLDVMSHRDRRGQLERALVLTPRDLVTQGWAEAAEIHSHLEPWPILAEHIDEKWEALLQPRGDLSIISYPSLVLATSKKGKVRKGLKSVPGLVRDDKKIAALNKHYNLVVLDESHKLRNHNSLWYSTVRAITSHADYVYGLTGTLFGSSPEEAWAQMFLVDGGASLGETLGLFRSAFMDAKSDGWSVKYEFRREMGRTFQRCLQHRCLRYDETELTELPERHEIDVQLDFSDEAREHYLRALDGLLQADGKLGELDAQWTRMRQICSGYIDWEDGTGRHRVVMKEVPKLERLLALIDTASASTKVVVAYDYTASAELVVARLKKEGIGFAWIYGGCKDPVAEKERFCSDPGVRVLVMNSEAGGTGTDGLQAVSRCLIFYESPPSPITRQQTIKRVHRPGQRHKTTIYNLMTRRSVEPKIVKSARDGKDLHDELVGAKSARGLALL